MEVVSQLEISLRQSFVTRRQRDQLYTAAEELARMLSGLRNALLGGREQ
jgi:hypothetical protein